MEIRVRAVVSGQVQGVFYRASTLEEAQRLNLSGSVENLTDGSVEIVAQGAQDRVEAFIQWAHHGPPEATVTEMRLISEAAEANPEGFRIIK